MAHAYHHLGVNINVASNINDDGIGDGQAEKDQFRVEVYPVTVLIVSLVSDGKQAFGIDNEYCLEAGDLRIIQPEVRAINSPGAPAFARGEVAPKQEIQQCGFARALGPDDRQHEAVVRDASKSPVHELLRHLQFVSIYDFKRLIIRYLLRL